MKELVKSQAERMNLLKQYFEPSPEDEEKGLKVPTKAHKAIAQLVADGYIRVIITTNFDRLIETALHEVQVTPTVLRTSDAIQGALPLAHSQCTVIKLHGDYLDTRIKNTPEELKTYDKATNALLNQVFDEYGLIVCGWSAEYDTALRAALKRCKSRRFTTYWTHKGPLNHPAQDLIALRHAETISIDSADVFFDNLRESIQSIEDYSHRHPMSTEVVIASMKRYIVDEKHKIRLHDLVTTETENLVKIISDQKLWPTNINYSRDELIERVKQYKSSSKTLINMVATGCYWGSPEQSFLWKNCIQRITNRTERLGGSPAFLNLQSYPALLLLYVGGIASITANKYYNLYSILEAPKLTEQWEGKNICERINVHNIFKNDVAHEFYFPQRRHTPGSDHMSGTLREFFRDYLPEDEEYMYIFNRFELLLALVYVYHQLSKPLNKDKERIWGPYGCFWWRRGHAFIEELRNEANTAKENWEPLKAGLWGNSIETFNDVLKKFEIFLKGLNFM